MLGPDRCDLSVQPLNIAKFCQKFGLRYDLASIRFRILDEQLKAETGGFGDLSVPLADFRRWKTGARTVFITENKSNGLSFPACKDSLVIFGLGGGVDLLQELEWLRGKDIWYWGDIDSHGFAILARLRRYFPHAQSFLMDEETFLAGKQFWVSEAKPYRDEMDLSRLTTKERELFFRIQENHYGQNLRLEQERIPFARLSASLLELCF